jgi:hypothetical protein
MDPGRMSGNMASPEAARKAGNVSLVTHIIQKGIMGYFSAYAV